MLPSQKDKKENKRPDLPAAPMPAAIRWKILSTVDLYHQAWEDPDAKFVARHAIRPDEGLADIHARQFPHGLWHVTKGPFVVRRPDMWRYIPDGLRFSQSEPGMPFKKEGICIFVAISFLLLRCHGLDHEAILARFRTPQFRDRVGTVMKQYRRINLQPKSRMALAGENLESIERWIRAQNYFEEPVQAVPALPARPSPARGRLPFLHLTGQLEFDPAAPLQREYVTTGAFQFKRYWWNAARFDEHIEFEKRGVKLALDVSGMMDAIRSWAGARAQFLRMGQHLFANLQRDCSERSMGGGRTERAFPFVELHIYQRRNYLLALPIPCHGHVLCVEFNMAGHQITTPRCIFDPNYGVICPADGFHSLSFETTLAALFQRYGNARPWEGHPPGLVVAFQYHEARDTAPHL